MSKTTKALRFDPQKIKGTALLKVVLFQGHDVLNSFYSLPSYDRKVLQKKRTLRELTEFYTKKYILSGKYPFSVAIIYNNQTAYAFGRSGKAQQELRYFENGAKGLREYSAHHLLRDQEKRNERDEGEAQC